MINFVVLAGSSNSELADRIADRLGTHLGRVKLSKFSNQETNVEIYESVRDKEVYIIQSGCGAVNDNFMELLIMLSACRTASAARVTAVIPCFPYARQSDAPFQSRLAYYHRIDRALAGLSLEDTETDEVGDGEEMASLLSSLQDAGEYTTAAGSSVSYKQWAARPGQLIANMLTTAGADHIITMDLHDPQYQGFFDIPVDVVYAEPTILNYIRLHIPDYRSAVIVSPDAGGAKRATAVANHLKLDLALIHREGRVNDDKRMFMVGNVKDRPAIIIDDIADTCRTLGLASEILHKAGASVIYAIVTHGMLSANALRIINRSHIQRLVVTNTIPLHDKATQCPKLHCIDIAGTLAEAIRRSHYGESVSSLFKDL
jgi:ribose-phosphate pyrophosphokinase